MSTTFFTSDQHLNHANILTFLDDGGVRIRPEFSSVDEMDQTIIERWNKIVGPSDKVYHLGDVTMNKKMIKMVAQLNGKKSLIMGNHDIFDAKEYLKYFSNVRGIKVFDNHILTHIPIVTAKERFRANVHGHTHSYELHDSWYLNICVEKTNYTPISWDEVKQRLQRKKEIYQPKDAV